MAFPIFIVLFIVFVFNLQPASSTLVSRLKSPYEYVAPQEDLLLPGDIEEQIYEDLFEEIPALRFYLHPEHKRNRTLKTRLPFLKINPKVVIHSRSNHEPEIENTIANTTNGEVSEAVSLSAEANSSNQTRDRRFFSPRHFQFYGPHMSTCFTCGMNSTYIPHSSLCHDAFESPDWRYRTLARYFRTKCYRNTEYWAQRIEEHWYENSHYVSDKGLKRGLYGPYIGGCYKRFMDVGTVYTQRGCRSWWPHYAHPTNFASHRYTRMEALLQNRKNVCIASPHASLTPFSRSISLFVRYHVCVCEGKYCNSGATAAPSLLVLSMTSSPNLSRLEIYSLWYDDRKNSMAWYRVP